MHAHLARNMSSYHVTIFKFYAKHCIRQRLGDGAFKLDGTVFFGHNLSILQRVAADSTRRAVLTGCWPGGFPASALPYVMGFSLDYSGPPLGVAQVSATAVNTQGPRSVIATVCSQWAAMSPSLVTTVQSSSRV